MKDLSTLIATGGVNTLTELAEPITQIKSMIDDETPVEVSVKLLFKISQYFLIFKNKLIYENKFIQACYKLLTA